MGSPNNQKKGMRKTQRDKQTNTGSHSQTNQKQTHSAMNQAAPLPAMESQLVKQRTATAGTCR